MSGLGQRWRDILLKHVTLEEQAEVLKFFAEITSLRASLERANGARAEGLQFLSRAEKRVAHLSTALMKIMSGVGTSTEVHKIAREALAAEAVSPAACSHSPER